MNGRKTYLQSVKYIKRCRESVGYSLRKLSSETGIHFCKIHRVEHGKDTSAIDYCTLMDWAAENNHKL